MMVLEPLACSGTGPECADIAAGNELDPGGVLFARTTDGAVLPVPPFDVLATGAPEPMQPLAIPGPGIPLDGTFMRASLPTTIPPIRWCRRTSRLAPALPARRSPSA